MPELPEVETVRRILDPHITGQTITGVTLRDFTAVLETTLPGVDPAPSIIGRTFTGTSRRGKYLMLHLDDGLYVIVHLRMTGRLLLMPATEPPVRFEHLAIHLANGADIRFGDQRKFGRVVLADQSAVDRLDTRLGPEPFDSRLTATYLHTALARRPGPIKNALLDQHLIAGLGNIYVDEALYRAKVNPLSPGRSLSNDQLKRLLQAVRHVLTTSLANQGTTFSTFENPYGETGTNADFLRAYNRAKSGEACGLCGTPFVHTVVAGRGTTYCPTCQPLPSA
jgi:formamidopyrimidine-DNA glycosylase